MIDTENLILGAIYSNLQDVSKLYEVSLHKLKKHPDLKNLPHSELFSSLELLKDKSYLSYKESIEKKDDLIISISIEGILSYENIHLNLNEFTELTYKFLKTVDEIEKKMIKLEPGKDQQLGKISFESFLKYASIDLKNKIKINFIRNKADGIFSRKIGWTNRDGLIFYGNRFVFLTPKGRVFLEFQKKLKNLFNKVTSTFAKRVLLQEYQDMNFLIKHNKWKDVLIKMGIIIEYLITDYFEKSGIGRDQYGKPKEYEITDNSGKLRKIRLLDAKFGQKLLYIIQNNTFGSSWTSDWVYVNNNIREFRNYVHLTKVITNNLIVNKFTIEQVYPIFEKIITLF